jgi:hypothetical protein
MEFQLVRRIRDLVSVKLGRCPKCMRWAFRGAVLGLLATLVAHQLIPSWWLAVLFGAMPFIGLWMLHILVFARRASRPISGVGERGSWGSEITRRDLILRGMRAAFLAVMVSVAVPRLSRSGGCPRGYHECSAGDWCCPDGTNFFCGYNECTGQHNECLNVQDDDTYYRVQKCCGVTLITCG